MTLEAITFFHANSCNMIMRGHILLETFLALNNVNVSPRPAKSLKRQLQGTINNATDMRRILQDVWNNIPQVRIQRLITSRDRLLILISLQGIELLLVNDRLFYRPVYIHKMHSTKLDHEHIIITCFSERSETTNLFFSCCSIV